MTTSSIFTLVTNDGKQDRILMATDLLRCRLSKLTEYYKHVAPKGATPKTPTVTDIERTHVFYLNAHYKPYVAIAFEYNKVATQGARFGSGFKFDIIQFGDFFSDMSIHLHLSSVTAPDALLDPINGMRLRYCDYFGIRALENVNFTVNTNPLDSYDSDTMMMKREFLIKRDKEIAWNRCVGQQVPIDAEIYMYENELTELRGINNGPQTWKKSQPAIDIFIPLDFWYKDPALSISSMTIPAGQRFITGKLASIDKILGAAMVSTVVGPPEYQTMTPTTLPLNLAPAIEAMELYTNNIFVNPEIADLYYRKIGFNMIRVHRVQRKQVTESTGSVQLNSLKWPIETMYFGFRPLVNLTSFQDWYKFARINLFSYDTPVITGTGTLVGRPANVRESFPVVDTMTFQAFSIELNKDAPGNFYNGYTPYRFGATTVTSPYDVGKYMLNMNLYPGKYKGSGYLNTSRAREIYLSYVSSYISSTNICEFVMVGIALNFLLVSNGTALLRYST